MIHEQDIELFFVFTMNVVPSNESCIKQAVVGLIPSSNQNLKNSISLKNKIL